MCTYPDYRIGYQYQLSPAIPKPVSFDSTAMALGSLIAQAEHGRANAEIENARLRDRLAAKQAAEEAYATISSGSGRTYTQDRTGRLVELINREITWAGHLIFQPPFPAREIYIVQFDGKGPCLTIEAHQFIKDSELLQAFQEFPGVEIRFCRSAKQTAALLRQAIAVRVEMITPPFWGGWQQDANHSFCFQIFSSGTTCADVNRLVDPLLSPQPMPQASVAVAAQRLQEVVCTNPAQPELWLLTLVYHTAALTSLLRNLGHPFPLAVCLLSESTATLAILRTLFGWYGDLALSLNLPSAVFSGQLLCRKDQPLLIEDKRCDNFAQKNAALLTEVLASGQIPWREGRNERYFPLQALPIVISTTASSLSVDPNVMVLELPTSLRIMVEEETNQDYLAAFIQFTTGHIDRLRGLLDKAQEQAFGSCEGCLGETCVVAQGVLLAVDAFVREFHRTCGLEAPPLDETCPGAGAWLWELLEQTSDKLLDCGDLAAQFILVARSMLLDGSLCPCPTEFEQEPPSMAVFYNADALGFTQPAFKAVCVRLGQSRPVILRALNEAGLLLGKPVNSGTPLTRISTWDVYGVRRTERVYKLPRSAFDQLGDPLVFGGEGSF